MSGHVPSITEQTGWKRGPCAVSICQDSDVLARIVEIDFDLNDAEFVRYFIARTGHDIINADCGWAAKKIAIMRAGERWEKIERGKLQDCWELYKSGHRGLTMHATPKHAGQVRTFTVRWSK